MKRLSFAVCLLSCLALQGAERSGRWPAVREHYLSQHPACEACGETQHLECHHIAPFAQAPALELSEGNLIALDRECHFRLGHSHDWKTANPNAREDAAYWRKKIEAARKGAR